MKAVLNTRTFVICPECGEGEDCVSHLFGNEQTSFGPWSCDECGIHYKVTIHSEDDIELEIVDKPAEKKLLTLLVLEPHDKPVYLALRDTTYEGSTEGKESLYNEHTCPTNYLSQVVEIIDGDDFDPHGIFQYVGSVFTDADFDFDEDYHIQEAVTKLLSERGAK